MVGNSIGSTLAWRYYGVLTPLGLLANALPIAPAGLGVGEAAFEYGSITRLLRMRQD